MTGRHRTLTLVFAVIALAFFMAPIGLRAVGVKAHCCPENRGFAPSPKLSDGWHIFDATTAFLIDRMPGRQRAVRANTWISQHVFATTPQYGRKAGNDAALPFTGHAAQNQASTGGAGARPGVAKAAAQSSAQVAPGTHGWLYLQGVFDYDCHPPMPLSEATSRWINFLRVVRHSGRRVVLVVAPDKSVIYPEYVSPSTPNLACSKPGDAAEWRHIESRRAQSAGIIGLRRPLLAAKARSRELLYLPKDSHWNSRGALTLAQAAVPALDPRIKVLPNEIVDTGRQIYGADLETLIGNSSVREREPTAAIKRAAGAPQIHGPTLFLDDSYGDVALNSLSPYFSQVDRIPWASETPGKLFADVNRAHAVVMEIVGRDFAYHMLNNGYVTPSTVRLLRRRLARSAERPIRADP